MRPDWENCARRALIRTSPVPWARGLWRSPARRGARAGGPPWARLLPCPAGAAGDECGGARTPSAGGLVVLGACLCPAGSAPADDVDVTVRNGYAKEREPDRPAGHFGVGAGHIGCLLARLFRAGCCLLGSSLGSFLLVGVGFHGVASRAGRYPPACQRRRSSPCCTWLLLAARRAHDRLTGLSLPSLRLGVPLAVLGGGEDRTKTISVACRG
jgi:hypothetical protein